MLKNILVVIAILSAFLLGLLMNFNMLYDDLKLIVPPAIAGLIATGSVYANFLISEKQQKTQIATTIEKEWRTDLRKHTAELIYNGLLFIHMQGIENKNAEGLNKQDEHSRVLAISYAYLTVLIPNEGQENIVFRELLSRFLEHCNNGKRDDKSFDEIADSLTILLPKILMPKGN